MSLHGLCDYAYHGGGGQQVPDVTTQCRSLGQTLLADWFVRRLFVLGSRYLVSTGTSSSYPRRYSRRG